MPAKPAVRWWLLREQLVEERWLINLVVVMLVSDVAAYQLLIETDGGDEVAASPERLRLIQTVGSLDLFLEPSGRFAFQKLHHV